MVSSVYYHSNSGPMDWVSQGEPTPDIIMGDAINRVTKRKRDGVQSDIPAPKKIRINFDNIIAHKQELRALEKRRSECPVTKKAIELQAQLIKAKGEGRAWASTQDYLDPIKTESINHVYRLKSLDSGQVTAYFKIGKEEEEAVGIMEKLMWDIAVIMRQEELFVPTGLAQVSTSDGMSTTGGIQPAQTGCTLKEYFKINPQPVIEKNNLLKATLASILFGMFDAHYENIFIDKNGKILFFDNTRSLPHSNGFVYWQSEGILSAYRSALLLLPKSFEDLSAEDLEVVRQSIEDWQRRLPDLKHYLNSKYVQALINKLPQDWFKVDELLAAMEERIANLQSAMSIKPPKNMRDLVTCFNPQYRFAFALQMAFTLINKGELNYLHNNIGLSFLEGVTQQISKKGYSVKRIQEIAENPNISWQEMCHAVSREIHGRPLTTRRDLIRLKNERYDLIFEKSKLAHIDDKD